MAKFIELHRVRDGSSVSINVESIVSFFTDIDQTALPPIECTGVTLNDRFWERIRVVETYDWIKEQLSPKPANKDIMEIMKEYRESKQMTELAGDRWSEPAKDWI